MTHWKDRLVQAVLAEYPHAHPVDDFYFVSTDAGPVLEHWNEDLLGPYVEADWQAKCEAVAQASIIAAIKAEAGRRIYEKWPLHKQLNAAMRATALTKKIAAGGTWTPEEQAEAAALETMEAEILAIRAASNAIEANPPVILAELETDPLWPSVQGS